MSENFHFWQQGKSNVSSRRVGVKWFHFKIPRVFTDGILAYSSPAFSFSFSLSLSPLSSFYVCRHIQRAIHKLKFIAFFKMNVCFCKKQLAMQVPAKRNAGCSIGFECLISHWLTRRGGRTYVRTVGHKWRHNLTKIFRMHAFPIFSYPWCFDGALRARSSAKMCESNQTLKACMRTAILI